MISLRKCLPLGFTYIWYKRFLHLSGSRSLTNDNLIKIYIHIIIPFILVLYIFGVCVFVCWRYTARQYTHTYVCITDVL